MVVWVHELPLRFHQPNRRMFSAFCKQLKMNMCLMLDCQQLVAKVGWVSAFAPGLLMSFIM